MVMINRKCCNKECYINTNHCGWTPLPYVLSLDISVINVKKNELNRFDHLAHVTYLEDLEKLIQHIKSPIEIQKTRIVDLNLFRNGILPNFEDLNNKRGCRICISYPQTNLINTAWNETVSLFFIQDHGVKIIIFASDSFEEITDNINGIVLSIRKESFNIWLWMNKTPTNNEFSRLKYSYIFNLIGKIGVNYAPRL
ncbi:hypothetical protein A3Q56_05858 [Intoshia linei]|uniref:Uncharacterized protein n=1 Tax=Intoshia linei TaxID=1819745 RepID=A0A177AWQ1_9BILA|nr:hypothetical protein A3Q56_05858 [Intoshia linei]